MDLEAKLLIVVFFVFLIIDIILGFWLKDVYDDIERERRYMAIKSSIKWSVKAFKIFRYFFGG